MGGWVCVCVSWTSKGGYGEADSSAFMGPISQRGPRFRHIQTIGPASPKLSEKHLTTFAAASNQTNMSDIGPCFSSL